MEIMDIRVHKDRSYGYLKIAKEKKKKMEMEMRNGGMFISLPCDIRKMMMRKIV